MFCRRAGWFLILLFLGACASKDKAKPPAPRLAVLRCENLSGDPALDWMGRAVSQILAADLTVRGGTAMVGPAVLRGITPAMGPRPRSAPGISAEREAALAEGANRLIYCQCAITGGKPRLAAVEEDVAARTMIRRGSAEGSLIAAADALARQIDPQARPFGTRSEAALEAFAEALDATGADQARQGYARAVAADPNFGAAYVAWIQTEATLHDADAVDRVVAQARAKALSDYDRALVDLEVAQLRNDAPARARALAALAKTGPADPNVFRVLAEGALAGRRYRDAIQYYEQALALAPGDIGLLNALGYAEAYLGDYDAAMRRLREYERLRPEEANPLDSQGDVNFAFNRYADAEKLYLAAHQKAPNFLDGGELLKAAQARLATGDLPGADQIFARYASALEARHDAAAPYQAACWRHLTGRRKEAVALLEPLAANAAGAQAAILEAQLAVWELEMGDRARAETHALKARTAVRGPAALVVGVAALGVELEAAPADWQERVRKVFGSSPESPARDLITAYALLLARHFAVAAPLLRHAWEEANPNTEEGLPVLLAWAMIESGKWDGVIPLVGPSPVPTATLQPLGSFYFPRLFYLRGRLAEHQGKREQAAGQYRLYLKLAGPDAEIWQDRAHAREFLGAAK